MLVPVSPLSLKTKQDGQASPFGAGGRVRVPMLLFNLTLHPRGPRKKRKEMPKFIGKENGARILAKLVCAPRFDATLSDFTVRKAFNAHLFSMSDSAASFGQWKAEEEGMLSGADLDVIQSIEERCEEEKIRDLPKGLSIGDLLFWNGKGSGVVRDWHLS